MQSPFIRKTVKCPACHHPYSQRYFRKNVFVIAKEEPDKHVAEYRWLNEKIEEVHPPFYFTAYCPKCYYTDILEDFSDPWRTTFGPYVIKYFRRLADSGDVVLDTLGGRVNYEEVDFVSALNMHYLALYAQFLPPPDLQDPYKIARLYLRIAWLYRENPPGSSPKPLPKPAKPKEDNGREAIKAVQSALDALEAAVKALTEPREQAQTAIADFIAGLDGGEPMQKALAPRERLAALQQELHDTIGYLRDETKKQKFARSTPPASPPKVEAPQGPGPLDPAQNRRLLEELRAHWAELPLTEEEAVMDAIEWFMQAIEKDSRLGSHEQYATIGMLVMNLRIGLNQFEQALDMVNGIYQSAVESRVKYMDRLREDSNLRDAERKQLEARLNKVASGIEDLVDFREDLIKRLFERDKTRIAAVLSATKGRPAKAREAALVAEGIRNEIITKLKRKGGPLAPPT